MTNSTARDALVEATWDSPQPVYRTTTEQESEG